MKKIVALCVFMACVIIIHAQKSVTIHGPYSASAKYTGSSLQKFHLTIKVTGDSAIIEQMKQTGQPDTITMSDVTSSEYLVLTGKESDSGNYSINMTCSSNTGMTMPGNQQSSKEQTITLSGYAKQDEAPHFDSIDITPKETMTDSVKNVLAKTFQYIGNIQLPHKEFHIGDTAIVNAAMPLQLPMINENIVVSEVFKLVKIENGSAIFVISFSMKFNTSGTGNDKIQFNGSGEGKGKCIYDIKNKFFKTCDSDMNFHVPFSTDANGQHFNAEMFGQMNMSMQFAYQPND